MSFILCRRAMNHLYNLGTNPHHIEMISIENFPSFCRISQNICILRIHFKSLKTEKCNKCEQRKRDKSAQLSNVRYSC